MCQLCVILNANLNFEQDQNQKPELVVLSLLIFQHSSISDKSAVTFSLSYSSIMRKCLSSPVNKRSTDVFSSYQWLVTETDSWYFQSFNIENNQWWKVMY